MEMIFGRLIQIQIEVKFTSLHLTSLHKANCFKTIQDQRLFYFYHDQGGNRDFNQEPSKCLLALFSLKIGKSTYVHNDIKLVN